MELRQILYFVKAAELGSITRAAQDLKVAQSAISAQIGRLEGELAVRLLQRTSRGVSVTDAGAAFLREAQHILRHADQAVRASQESRLAGTVSVGIGSATALILAMPFMCAMRERYPDIRLHMVEGMSGQLASLLDNRRLDFAVLLNTEASSLWDTRLLLRQHLYLIQARDQTHAWPGAAGSITPAQLRDVPLMLPAAPNGLRSIIWAACSRAGFQPTVIAEIDSLPMLMDAVGRGLGSTIQPWAALGRIPDAAQRFHLLRIDDPDVWHVNALCSLHDRDLTTAALRARRVLIDCVTDLVGSGRWASARLLDLDS